MEILTLSEFQHWIAIWRWGGDSCLHLQIEMIPDVIKTEQVPSDDSERVERDSSEEFEVEEEIK